MIPTEFEPFRHGLVEAVTVQMVANVEKAIGHPLGWRKHLPPDRTEFSSQEAGVTSIEIQERSVALDSQYRWNVVAFAGDEEVTLPGFDNYFATIADAEAAIHPRQGMQRGDLSPLVEITVIPL
jgi:hypothetical protein